MSRVNIIALVIFAGVVVWIFTLGGDAVQSIQRGALALASPFVSAKDRVADSVSGDELADYSREELIDLINRNNVTIQELKIREQALGEVFQENQELKNQLKFQNQSGFTLIPAEIVGRDTTTWYQTLTLSKGSVDGVVRDAAVLIDTGLVGKVTVVNENNCEVLLLTDEACKVSVRVMGTPEEGIVQGQRVALGSPQLRLRYLSKTADVRPGMGVMSSGAGGVFPENLTIGNISEVIPGDITTEAIVDPAVSFAALKFAFVRVEPVAEEVAPTIQATPIQPDGQGGGQ